MNLKTKINTINKPKVAVISTGSATSVSEFWNKEVVPFLPKKDVMYKIHRVLIDYVNNDQALFSVRAFNSAKKGSYDKLRRGFLNQVGKSKFFYTDNFFAAYFAKMAIDGYVPDLNELLDMMENREFPSRFGPDCSEERSIMAIGKGVNPGLSTAGYKIAHIFNVGKDYYINNKKYNMSALTSIYFPRGERNDWKNFTDKHGNYKMRIIDEKPLSRSILKAIFLRFVHPINYIITPSKTCEINDKNPSTGIGEYEELLKYAHNYFLTTYPDIYKEYLSYIYPCDNADSTSSFIDELNIRYGYKINKKEVEKEEKELKKKKKIEKEMKKIKSSTNAIDADVKVRMAAEYLSDSSTSFRKIEINILHLDSKVRGGGFIAKTAINSLGITAEMKGLLERNNIDDLILVSSSSLKKILKKIKAIID